MHQDKNHRLCGDEIWRRCLYFENEIRWICDESIFWKQGRRPSKTFWRRLLSQIRAYFSLIYKQLRVNYFQYFVSEVFNLQMISEVFRWFWKFLVLLSTRKWKFQNHLKSSEWNLFWNFRYKRPNGFAAKPEFWENFFLNLTFQDGSYLDSSRESYVAEF